MSNHSHKKHIRLLVLVGIISSIYLCINSFLTFYKFRNSLGTHIEWKFFTSVTGLVISNMLFLLLMSVLVFKNILEKLFKKTKGLSK